MLEGNFNKNRESHENKVNKIEDPIAKRNKMFDELLEMLPNFRDDHTNVVSSPIQFLFHNSVQDGLEFARRARLTPSEIYDLTIQNDFFQVFHRDTTDQFFKNITKINLDNSQKKILKNTEDNKEDKFLHSGNRSDLQEVVGYDKLNTQLSWGRFGDTKAFDVIEDYYKEFLPYRTVEMKKSREEYENEKGIKQSKEELRKEHLENGMDLALKHIILKIEDEIKNQKGDITPQMIEGILKVYGIDDTEAKKYSTEMLKIYENDNIKDGYPTLVLRDRTGNKTKFELDKARKPVAKIIENITANSIKKDIEVICDDLEFNNHDRKHKIIFDQVFNKHIITKEPIKRPNAHERAEEILNLRKLLGLTEKIAKEKNISFKNLSVQEILDGFDKKQSLPEDEKQLDKISILLQESGTDFYEHSGFKDVINNLSENSNEEGKNFIEVVMINDRIENSDFVGIAEYLGDALNNKNESILTKKQIGELFAKLEDKINTGPEILKSRKNDLEDSRTALKILDTFKTKDLNELVSYVHNMESIQEKYKKEDEIKNKRDIVSKSIALFDFVKDSLKDKAKSIMTTMPAKADVAPSQIADELISACFPKEWHNYEVAIRLERDRRGSGVSGSLGLMQNRFESRLSGGNVGEEIEGENSLGYSVGLDKNISAMLITNVVAYSNREKKWTRVYVPIDGGQDEYGEFEIINAKLSKSTKNAQVLPVPLGVRNVKTNRGEVQQDSLGITMSPSSNNNLESYSFEYQQIILFQIILTKKNTIDF